MRGLGNIIIKTYTTTVKTEVFDGSDEMIEKYDIKRRPVDVGFGDIGVLPSIHTLEGNMWIHKGDWIATGVNGDPWVIADDIFKKSYVEVGNDKKIVKAVQFYSWDEKMIFDNRIDNYDYGIYLIDINGLRVFLSQGDWIVTYRDGSQFVILDEDWKGEK